MKKIVPAALAAALAVSLVGCGATPDEAETVTKTVEVTPQACLDALDAAGVGFDLAAEGMGYSADAIDAAANLDVAGIDAATANMTDLTDRIAAAGVTYRAARDECREGR